MVKKVITLIKYPVLIAGIVLCLVGIVQAATGNIDPTDKWAWGTNVGWINFRPEHGGVTVYGDHLEGYAWGENIGWIRLGTHTSGGAHTYGNTTNTNYGVNNDGAGNLSGYAWGTNAGWINFNPSHSQVTINTSNGSFDGYAWGENIGWIHFKNVAPAYNVVTTFTRKTLTVNKAGTGDGTVTSNPPGINCGADCAEAYDQDTVVTLTANADGDSDFAGWSGDCSGTNSTTTVTMDGDKTCTATFDVLNVAPTVGTITAPVDPVQVNTEINASADFTDTGVLDTHTAVWDWGDGSQCDTSTDADCTVTETSGSGSVSGSHTYTAAGVYTVKLTVTDDDGESGQSVFEFIVVYDPDAGFVTGGGWIDSPAGAYLADPDLTGKATFGFVSRYKKGATVPTGQTEFQLRVADLNFHSSSYQWLVIAGARAQYKGLGTINGEGEYKFMLWAGDDEPDTFRIKIWEEDGFGVETVIYDNGLNQAIGGGSIVIHKKK